MTPAHWGDSYPPRNIDDLSKPGVPSLEYYLTTFVEGYLVGKTPAELANLNTMADAEDFAEFDSFAGSSVTMNNLLRVIQGLQKYHVG